MTSLTSLLSNPLVPDSSPDTSTNFFVADEPQVPSWNVTPPQDPDAIETLAGAFMASDGHISHVLSVLFNADFFKEARFKKVKSPTELVTGILKLVGTFQSGPEPGINQYASATQLMGQKLLDPPTVEGWHTGKEWIDGGLLTAPRQLRRSRGQRCVEAWHSGDDYAIEG